MFISGDEEEYKVSRNEQSSIEPEEIFFDAKVKRNFWNQGGDLSQSRMEVPLGFKNFFVVGFLIITMFLVMFFYNFYIQIFLKEKFRLQAKINSMRVESIKAPRGIIYDHNMKALVSNEPSFDVILIPKDLSTDSVDDYIGELSDIIGVSENELRGVFENSDRMSIVPIILKENLDKNLALLLEAQISNFKGIEVEKNAVRDYKDGMIFSHLIGYTAKISGEELKLKKNYLPTDYIGKTGIEQYYEDFLRGENGKYVSYLDARHNTLREGLEREPKVGDSVILSIDADLQKLAYESLKEATSKAGLGGVFIAINPKDGKILSAVSAPGYDNNLFSRGISNKDYQSLLQDKSKLLFNRIISGKYPPGSSIKPYIGAAALEENIITPDRQILSTGSIAIGDNPETAYVFNDWKIGGHGWVNIGKAIAQSVNTYFYTIGGGYGDIKGLGMEKIKKHLEQFGFNNLSGIDILGESGGFIPTPEWKKEKIGESWYIGDTYNASIGQGYITVTPLQIALAVSTIANGGILFEPKLAERIIDSNKKIIQEFAPEIIRKDFIQKNNIEVIRRAMRETVSDGSARSLNELPIKVAGKTGTAQFGGDGKTHAWFSGWAPYENPEIAIVVLVEGGGEGFYVSVPIAKEIFKWWAEQKIKDSK